jgi:hypothetical protein
LGVPGLGDGRKGRRMQERNPAHRRDATPSRRSWRRPQNLPIAIPFCAQAPQRSVIARRG